MAERSQPSANYSSWPVVSALTIVSLPLLLMYVYLFLDTVTVKQPDALLPSGFTVNHWRFLWQTTAGKANIWQVTVNTLLFSACTTSLVLLVSSMAGYVLSRLNVPARGFFLAGVMVLHAFPSVTLIIAIFIVLQMIGLYNSLIGVILVKAAIDLPLGIWLMKGFYDTVPWEIEMAGVVDGASRFRVWKSLVLPQVKPGIMALGLFSFLSGWGEFILPQVLAPGNDVQVLSVYLAGFLADDNNYDFNMFKAVGLFYLVPVLIAYALFNKYLMNIYGGGSKG
ncbi:carbohydrate ABC transporter permease [Rhizobium lentis]|uniref:Maltose/maltodextrin transport system permease protein MalG n=1 Tax=Rhizobium lentis TaxID=1138194 RepID=A0A9Q3QWV7_9HYPH|nr:carbohydrate ABC transporter permease [Rhizobium lentis]MBX4957474.1 carbohydrate ABC transporter permease [Rhizobium lentis]MBX4974104.1 carbohydrate ABC transporter permease [Rhizobium lentis]MBX4987464.1 carbohydrate ABC transporter permease [Rhizobium lentis]MBX5000213.1 carbohydrate ABC transporter permease [Rhizobium lentis]MBX5005909.1 carbohydrate ABC transporter permease [Rhizobium lentis]